MIRQAGLDGVRAVELLEGDDECQLVLQGQLSQRPDPSPSLPDLLASFFVLYPQLFGSFLDDRKPYSPCAQVMVNEVAGQDWLDPDWFRFGASTLLNDLLMQRTKMTTGRYSGPDYFTLD